MHDRVTIMILIFMILQYEANEVNRIGHDRATIMILDSTR